MTDHDHPPDGLVLGARCNACDGPLDGGCPLCAGCCEREASETGRSPSPVVEEGQVRLGGGALLLHTSEGCEVWDIDCNTKYAEGTVAIGEDEVEVLLWKGERTLRADDTTDKPTRLTFAKVGDGVMFDGGRYSWRLAMFTYNRYEDDLTAPARDSA